MVLLGLLVLLAVGAAAGGLAAQRWADTRQRDAEARLLAVGLAYRQAIESYYLQSPGGARALPQSVDDLLQDPRHLTVVRHLRKAYADPLAPERPLALIRVQGGIVGVYSEATGQPFRHSGFDPMLRNFEQAKTYQDWRFTYVPPVARQIPGTRPGRAIPPGPPAPPPRR